MHNEQMQDAVSVYIAYIYSVLVIISTKQMSHFTFHATYSVSCSQLS